jgi:hypothetical protein
MAAREKKQARARARGAGPPLTHPAARPSRRPRAPPPTWRPRAAAACTPPCATRRRRPCKSRPRPGTAGSARQRERGRRGAQQGARATAGGGRDGRRAPPTDARTPANCSAAERARATRAAHLRRLARARLALDDDDLVVAHQLLQLREEAPHGQLFAAFEDARVPRRQRLAVQKVDAGRRERRRQRQRTRRRRRCRAGAAACGRRGVHAFQPPLHVGSTTTKSRTHTPTRWLNNKKRRSLRSGASTQLVATSAANG